MTNSADSDQLASSVLHCLQRKGFYRFSRENGLEDPVVVYLKKDHSNIIFLAHLSKAQQSYCDHPPSVVVIRRQQLVC